MDMHTSTDDSVDNVLALVTLESLYQARIPEWSANLYWISRQLLVTVLGNQNLFL